MDIPRGRRGGREDEEDEDEVEDAIVDEEPAGTLAQSVVESGLVVELDTFGATGEFTVVDAAELAVPSGNGLMTVQLLTRLIWLPFPVTAESSTEPSFKERGITVTGVVLMTGVVEARTSTSDVEFEMEA